MTGGVVGRNEEGRYGHTPKNDVLQTEIVSFICVHTRTLKSC
jgi:hypothetical protein